MSVNHTGGCKGSACDQDGASIVLQTVANSGTEDRKHASAGMRLLLVASAGGHWVQLNRLAPAFEGMEIKFVTTVQQSHAPSGPHPVAKVSDASIRRPHHVVLLMAQMSWVMLRFRPRVVVSTGAAPGVAAIWIGRLLGARTIWIDSIANSEKISLSARLVAGQAHVRLTQWPHLVDQEANLHYIGAVL